MTTPLLHTLISTQVEEFFDQVPGVRDGDPEAIHQARVACRRLRELFPLVDNDRAPQAAEVAQSAGRQLGRVRDLDVMADLLEQYQHLVPAGAVSVAIARRTLTQNLGDQRRELIKSLEKLDLDRLAEYRVHGFRRQIADVRAFVGVHGDWSALRARIRERAKRVRKTIKHAAGVYFPNRLHRTRIAIKKLRYAVEVAEQLRVWHPPHLLGDLRKGQALLGEMHDLQVLSEQIGDLAGSATASEVPAVRHALEVDIARLHRRYLDRRERLLAASEACAAFAARSRLIRIAEAFRNPFIAVSTASAIAAPAIWWRMKATRSDEPLLSERVLAIGRN
jgi:CHAD domain-containing protein